MDKKIKELENYLIPLDSMFEDFARHHKLKLSKNSKDWPERSFSWVDGKLNKLMQIYLESESKNTFLIWGCVTRSKLFKRYWFKLEPQRISPPFEWKILEKLFLEEKRKLDNIREHELLPIDE
jgi:hypothetical protein